jgi:hypothetical protein
MPAGGRPAHDGPSAWPAWTGCAELLAAPARRADQPPASPTNSPRADQRTRVPSAASHRAGSDSALRPTTPSPLGAVAPRRPTARVADQQLRAPVAPAPSRRASQQPVSPPTAPCRPTLGASRRAAPRRPMARVADQQVCAPANTRRVAPRRPTARVADQQVRAPTNTRTLGAVAPRRPTARVADQQLCAPTNASAPRRPTACVVDQQLRALVNTRTPRRGRAAPANDPRRRPTAPRPGQHPDPSRPRAAPANGSCRRPTAPRVARAADQQLRAPANTRTPRRPRAARANGRRRRPLAPRAGQRLGRLGADAPRIADQRADQQLCAPANTRAPRCRRAAPVNGPRRRSPTPGPRRRRSARVNGPASPGPVSASLLLSARPYMLAAGLAPMLAMLGGPTRGRGRIMMWPRVRAAGGQTRSHLRAGSAPRGPTKPRVGDLAHAFFRFLASPADGGLSP